MARKKPLIKPGAEIDLSAGKEKEITPALQDADKKEVIRVTAENGIKICGNLGEVRELKKDTLIKPSVFETAYPGPQGKAYLDALIKNKKAVIESTK
ncbi:hypothetical protein NO1_1746 [Candidatus Termititenax aidoneus]|uniref:Uncharacterized protein n=1 Tax=Termititenax aidoneus TaxID=2218524 RepID=A0A388TD55_TERA1|nr:hypothetical protein NO1_1746 [Candidatus Termititenax aidoneus]